MGKTKGVNIMIDNMRKLCSAAAVFAMLAAGCNAQSTESAVQQPTEAMVQPERPGGMQQTAGTQDVPAALLNAETPVPSCDVTALFSDRDLSGTYDTAAAVITCSGDSIAIEGSGAAANGADITITEEGVYRITGTLNDGQILVNSPGKVQLVLEGASLSCSDSAPIYVQQAKKCFLTLAPGTENSVSDGSPYVYAAEGDNEPDAAIFSADSLTINGSGSLTVNGNYNEGITSKDDLVITGGTLHINAVGNGIKGKDYVAVSGGDLTITSGADGLKATNATDAGCGFVYVEDGNLTIDAQEDGIQAETELIVKDGTFRITSGGGTANAQPQRNNDFEGGRGGFGNWGSFDETNPEDDTSVSTKAMKAGALLYLAGGDFSIDTADDGLHSNGDLCCCGASVEITAGGDGMHADGLADLTEGTLRILRSSEGIEAAGIRVSGGTIELTSSDDGFNASDGTSQGAMGTYSGACALEISGGSVYVNADGDGLDSNGDLLISGGTVIVDGPTNSGNGALDGNGNLYASGGLLIAAGSSGMAEYPKGSQNTAIITLPASQPGGTVVTICDSSGTELLRHAPAKQFNSFIISSPDLKDGGTYTVCTDGTEAGSFTVSSILSYVGEAGGMMGGGFHGERGDGMGGGWGNRHDMQMPTDESGNIAMPEDMQIPDRMEIPTDENGDPVMPEDMQIPGGMQQPQGGFPGGMPPQQ